MNAESNRTYTVYSCNSGFDPELDLVTTTRKRKAAKSSYRLNPPRSILYNSEYHSFWATGLVDDHGSHLVCFSLFARR